MPIKAADTLEPNGNFSIANAKDVQVDIQTEGQRLDDYLANLQLQQGEKGDKGDPGEKGEKGEKGDKGDPADTEALTAAYKAADEEILNQAKLYAGSAVGGAAGSVLQEAKAYTDQKVVDLATGEHTHAVVTSTENGFMSPALLAQLNTATADIKTVTTTANAAKTAAATAQTTADNAKTAAATAQTTANTAKTNAATAQTTADNAKTAAATAQTTANTAKTNAATAQTTADNAKTAAGYALVYARNLIKNSVASLQAARPFNRSKYTVSNTSDGVRFTLLDGNKINGTLTEFCADKPTLTQNLTGDVCTQLLIHSDDAPIFFDSTHYTYSPAEHHYSVTNAIKQIDSTHWLCYGISHYGTTELTASQVRVPDFRITAGASATYIELSNYKIAKVGYPTIWTPAPEDEINHDTATSYNSVTAAVNTIASSTSTGSTSKPTASVSINESTSGIGSATTTTAFFTATKSGKLTIPSGIKGTSTLTVSKSSGTLTYAVTVDVYLTKNDSNLQSATGTGTLGTTSTATTAALSGGTFSYVKGDVFAVKLYTVSSSPTGSITGMQAGITASVTTSVTYTAVNDVSANEIFANGQLMAGATNKYFAVSSKATDGEIFRARSTNALLRFTASGLLQSFNGGSTFYRANPLVLVVRLTYNSENLSYSISYNPLGKTVSASRNSTGDYIVTHGLGHTNYTVVGSGHGSEKAFMLYMSVISRTTTTVNIRTSDDATLNDLTELDILFFDYSY